MKERPILFNTEMVRAILDGRKTQTRRIWRKPKRHSNYDVYPRWVGKLFHLFSGGHCIGEIAMCPYGQPDDQLWVRETWATLPLYDRMKPSQLVPKGTDLWWRAGGHTRFYNVEHGKWRPSIFMPRWASRLTLKVLDVRVEQVQSISHEDALAEGIDPEAAYNDYGTGSIYRDTFAALWDSINAKRGFSWASNPWVWAVTFEVVGGI